MKRTHRLSISAKIVNHRKSGKESKAMLRQRFEAETDTEVGTHQSGLEALRRVDREAVGKEDQQRIGQGKRDAQKQDAESHEHTLNQA